MHDRFVKIESSSDNKNKGEIVRFSSLLEQKNIVLLGEPGAGKSFLFEGFSEKENAESYTAANFDAYASTIAPNSALYIDALDESRNRVNPNRNALTGLIKLLHPLNLSKFRTSCRSADWFGETDLASFKPYFEKQGGYIVVSLHDLEVEECIQMIMASKNVDESNAKDFISKCHEKEVLDFIKTPLGLFMLYDTVHHKNEWPESKFELYKNLSEKLLEEHNRYHQDYNPSTISSEKLQLMAGKICAILLISGQSEIEWSGCVSNLPKLTDFSFFELSELKVLMSTKVFKSVNSNQVTYFHRTVAEFLAGQWLAEQINQKKLSLTRILSLILINGKPPIELRGFFAWVSCLVVSDGGDIFVDADPLGMLMYGDVSRLTISTKKQLLNALVLLSEQDPYFRVNNWATSFLGNLSSKELLPHFSRILKNPENFHLNSLILDALIQGAWHNDMTEPLKEIVSDPKRPLVEQKMAIRALCFKAPCDEFVHDIYHFLLKISASSQLTISFFCHFYERGFQPKELVFAVKAYLNNTKENEFDALYGLAEKIPDSDLTNILNEMSQAGLFKRHVATRSVNRRGHRFYLRVLIRRLNLSPKLKIIQLFYWFRALDKLGGGEGFLSEELKPVRSWLDENQDSLALLYKLILEYLSRKNKIDQLYDFNKKFDYIFYLGLRTENKLNILISKIKSGKLVTNSPLFEFYYRKAFELAVLGSKFHNEYEYLCSLSDIDTNLKPLQEKTTYEYVQCRLEVKQREVKESRKRQDKKQNKKLKNRRDILNNENLIREGKHDGWCQWLGQAYCRGFDKEAGFYEGFKAYFGDSISPSIAIEGLLNVFKNEISLTYPKLLEEVKNNRYSRYDDLVAGMDIYWNQQLNRNGFGVDELKTIFALACFFPTSTERELSNKAWKKQIIENNPDVAADVYWDVISVQVENNSSNLLYLHEFLMEKTLIVQKTTDFLHIISNYPVFISENGLTSIILALVKYHDDRKELVSFIKQNLLNKKVNKDCRAIWYSFGLMLNFAAYKDRAIFFLTKEKSYVWRFVELYEMLKTGNSENVEFIKIREFSILLVGCNFPNVYQPLGQFIGEQNSWDASRFVRDLISEIASSSEVEASQVLKKLSENPCLGSYSDLLKHSYSKCVDTIRQNDFNQPSLKETINILESRVPERIDDLLAFTMDVFNEICTQIQGGNSDIFKGFWNEDQYGRVITPKVEESCRDRLLDLMRPSFQQQGLRVEPELHMHSDKRVDISILSTTLKLPIEIKRQMHPDIWTACENQLERLYSIDPESDGYGVYLIFWYGLGSDLRLKKHPKNLPINSSKDLEKALISLLPEHKKERLKVVVMDVSGGAE